MEAFWDYVSSDSYPDSIPEFREWWDYWHSVFPSVGVGETARRYSYEIGSNLSSLPPNHHGQNTEL
ncbi:MAG: hypothetical protein WAJ93_03025 [Candidatus Nitrosopolaris sp.]